MQAVAPSESLAKVIGGAGRHDGRRQEADADHPGGKQHRRGVAREGTERLGGLRRRVDLMLACLVQGEAVARMMKYMTRFEDVMPMIISLRLRRSSASVAPFRCEAVGCPSEIFSSTSSLDCQV
ncbi:hypothetical protein GCM10010994_41000 [Chelatococcus reniformis]|uniref:Uncharacterized protein n=1 Tax=Chelatococcus reniformis TaxID=1494448 RepID=A0A916UMF9_9HYPH|nr:hypothetical protein GCM10010994_41000 [Chelatococcus reniformis]